MQNPTPYPDVNFLLTELMKSVQSILGSHFVGLYLDGSLAGGDFDRESDIDFVVVTDEDISADQFAALQAMHDRLAELDSPWADQLEGFYLSQHALLRHDPGAGPVPNLERGPGERLKMVPIDQAWEVHRYMLRERGITLAGPAPQSLIDPVSPAQLGEAMRFLLSGWVAGILADPGSLNSRGYQAYTVLSLCRMLYTLQHGEVVSKQAAARWAQGVLEQRWANLVARAWEGRQNPDRPPSAEEVEETLEFIRYTLDHYYG